MSICYSWWSLCLDSFSWAFYNWHSQKIEQHDNFKVTMIGEWGLVWNFSLIQIFPYLQNKVRNIIHQIISNLPYDLISLLMQTSKCAYFYFYRKGLYKRRYLFKLTKVFHQSLPKCAQENTKTNSFYVIEPWMLGRINKYSLQY